VPSASVDGLCMLPIELVLLRLAVESLIDYFYESLISLSFFFWKMFPKNPEEVSLLRSSFWSLFILLFSEVDNFAKSRSRCFYCMDGEGVS